MLSIWLVDYKTRLILPCTQWSYSSVTMLAEKGHVVQREAFVSSDFVDNRDDDEREAALNLLKEARHCSA